MNHSIRNIPYLFLLVFAFLMSCTTNESTNDSKDIAEEHNDDKFNTHDGEKDAQFVVDMVSGTQYEIKLAEYAEEKSANADIRSMASKMENEHEAMLNSLKQIATAKSISVPNEDSIEIANAMKDLNDRKPEDFDKEWTNKMVEKHKESINKLENGLKDVTDAEIKNWIETSLPTVRAHYDMLNKIHEEMK